MRILLLAPHPFYQPRGTPIAVDLLLRALSELGHEVDLLTFHEGEDRHYDNVMLHRISPPFSIDGIRPGFSGKKLLCDGFLFARFVAMMLKKKYDVVHAVEESAFMALAVCPFMSRPFIFDIDSSMTTQIVDKFTLMRPLRGLLAFLEALPMKYSAAVIPVCDALAEDAKKAGAKHIVTLKDISLLDMEDVVEADEPLRDNLGINGPIAMYIGNLESYQGIDLMLESFRAVVEQQPDARLIVFGGVPDDIEKYQRMTQSLGLSHAVHFLGPRPVESLGYFMQQADVLISPRVHGVNTPMKLYSYLGSGVPVLATALPTHTQVMTPEMGMLAAPTVNEFSRAWLTLVEDRELQRQLADQARQFIEQEHSYPAFREKLQGLYDLLNAQRSTA